MKSFKTILLACIAVVVIAPQQADACTRAVYKGNNGLIITGRTMDWKDDIESDLWIFPRGMKRDGAAGQHSVEWTSKYGSVVTAAYNIGSSDGMNEKGLVANLLYLAESDYGKWDGKKKRLTIAAWVQYVLDNFATVDEAVKALSKETFSIASPVMPNGALSALHLALSDPGGDNAIFEYIDGKLVIHHGKEFTVMTNSPTFDQQLALDEYWKGIGGLTMLPGTNRASDRFVRASFYIDVIPKTDDAHLAVASVFGVIRNTSVPYGISTPDQPNISTTRWRTVADQRELVYYFESTLTPNTFWIPMKDLNLSSGAPVLKLSCTHGEIYAGNAVQRFVPTEAFKFLGVNE